MLHSVQPKTEEEASKPKRPRGRPPKQPKPAKEDGDDAEEPPKKKRGRPPKVPKPDTEGGEPSTGTNPPVEKKKRGRPPKSAAK